MRCGVIGPAKAPHAAAAAPSPVQRCCCCTGLCLLCVWYLAGCAETCQAHNRCLTIDAADFLKTNATVGPSSAGHEAQTVPALEVVSQVLLEGGEVRLQALKVMAVAASNNVPFQRSVLRDQELIVPFLVEVRRSVRLGDM